jgi:hypothetical protein
MVFTQFMVYFNHQHYALRVDLALPVKDTLAAVGKLLTIDMSQFVLQVHDDRFRTYIDFTQEYALTLPVLVLPETNHSLLVRVLHRQQAMSAATIMKTSKITDECDIDRIIRRFHSLFFLPLIGQLRQACNKTARGCGVV